MKLNSIIVEDEETSREILKNYLKKYCPNVSVLGEAANVDEALMLIRNNELDLVFLDVEMPYGNAFDLLEKVGDINFETVFVTAYNNYALEALNAHASYYLMKPISIDELIKAVDYVVEIKTKEDALQNQVLITKTKSVAAPRFSALTAVSSAASVVENTGVLAVMSPLAIRRLLLSLFQNQLMQFLLQEVDLMLL